jgi:hypothetical protein
LQLLDKWCSGQVFPGKGQWQGLHGQVRATGKDAAVDIARYNPWLFWNNRGNHVISCSLRQE